MSDHNRPADEALVIDVSTRALPERRPKLSLRVNGTRVGAAARPAEAAPAHLPAKRLGLRVHASLSTRPNDYMPDDDEAVS